MFEQQLTMYAFNLGYCGDLLRDFTEEDMQYRVTPETNCPAWILGHLAICTDFALGVVGAQPTLPKKWHVLFGNGQTPGQELKQCPSKAELWDAYKSGHAAVDAAVRNADFEALKAEREPESILYKQFPTHAGMLSHLLATHEATHIGQLSVIRRSLGHPPLL